MTAHGSTHVTTPAAPPWADPPADRAAGQARAAVTVGDTARADEERDYVGEDSIHSFPASDPPGWIAMWAGTPITNADHREEVV